MNNVYHFNKNSQQATLKQVKQGQSGFFSADESTQILTNQGQQIDIESNRQKSESVQGELQKTTETIRKNGFGEISESEAKRIIKQNDSLNAFQFHPFRHLIFNPNISESIFKKHLLLTYRGLVYSTKCLKGPSEKFIQCKQVSVNQARNPTGNTLFLDLDETLIHSCALNENPEIVIKAFDNKQFQIGFRVRPFCMEFLQKVSKFWDIYIFTASSSTYASAIINYLDPEAEYINGILNRTNCMETRNGFYIKDLRIVKGKNIKKTILVDNLSHSFGFQIDNGIPILEWHDDKSDIELKYLTAYLIEAASVEDVRVFNNQRLRLKELAQCQQNDV